MSINIATNVSSLRAQRNLASVSDRLATSYARLSSGLRINSAADDAAGLSIAETLKADSRVAATGIRNASDGISVITIADQTVGEISNVLGRLAELAQQSANGIYSNDQRSALAAEFSALSSEIERVALTTEFNGLRLLSGGAGIAFQVGFDGTSLSTVSYSGVAATLQALGLANSGSSVQIYSILDTQGPIESISAAQRALDAVNAAISSLSRNRGTLGVAESRLAFVINNLRAARENFIATESRIRDVDVASEAAELSRVNILQQAATAMLGQANQQPQLALQLLGGR
jgi:flagellin